MTLVIAPKCARGVAVRRDDVDGVFPRAVSMRTRVCATKSHEEMIERIRRKPCHL